MFRRDWQPASHPRAAIVLVHGFGEHSGRYQNVGMALSATGYAVHAYDLRGHGQSPGKRGHIDGWKDYREDLAEMVRTVRDRHPGLPLFLYGHSMGALVAAEFTLSTPGAVDGLILSATPLLPVDVASPVKVAVARALSRVLPRFSLKLGLDAAHLSRDPAVVRAYQLDPLVHGAATARWGSETLRITGWIRDHVSEISAPVLIIHGAADRIASAAGSQALHEAVANSDKRLIVYPESFHEPHNDVGHDARVRDVGNWIDAHLRPDGGYTRA
jgi:alpha-beta hydrolase superfamily lysophospholipase